MADSIERLRKEVREKLKELNLRLDSPADTCARSFYLERDDDLDDYVATVIFVTQESSVDYVFDILDRLCVSANDSLTDLVAYVDCVYRTEDEYQTDFEADSQWSALINPVEDIAA